MEQQPPKKSLLILLAVAVVVVGLVIVKSLPKEEAEPARPTPADHPVPESADAVPEDPTRYGSDEEALSEEAVEAQRDRGVPTEEAAEETLAATVQDSPSEPEPKQPPPTGPEPAQPPLEPKPAAPQPAHPGAKEPVAPLPGSKLEEALTSGQPTMADFGAGWCQPCKMMDPVLKEAARKYRGKANIVYVDTDKFPQIARDYKIRAIPTQIFFDASGEEVNRHMGYWPIESLARALAAAGVSE